VRVFKNDTSWSSCSLVNPMFFGNSGAGRQVVFSPESPCAASARVLNRRPINNSRLSKTGPRRPNLHRSEARSESARDPTRGRIRTAPRQAAAFAVGGFTAPRVEGTSFIAELSVIRFRDVAAMFHASRILGPEGWMHTFQTREPQSRRRKHATSCLRAQTRTFP
jgi:hypothetical protein